MIQIGWRSTVLASLTATLTATLVSGWGVAVQAMTLQGGGTDSVVTLYDRLIPDMAKDLPTYTMTYKGISSSYGLRQMAREQVDFAVVDVPPSALELDQVNRGVIAVPIAIKAVAVAYNLPNVPSLNLSRPVLADIFLGRISTWDDASIQRDNPGVRLPNLPIEPIVRLDSSSITFLFTRYLSTISSVFNNEVGTSYRPEWSGKLYRGTGDAGMIEQINQHPGSIGYIAWDNIQASDITIAAIENRNNEFVLPSSDTLVAAQPDTRVIVDEAIIPNLDPKQGYPMTSYAWLLLYQEYNSAEKADAIRKMVQWSITTGQTKHPDFSHISFSPKLVSSLLQEVDAAISP